MRTRTGHSPGDWSANDPCPAVTHRRAFEGVGAEQVGSMRPLIHTIVTTDADRERQRRREAHRKAAARSRMRPVAFSIHLENKL